MDRLSKPSVEHVYKICTAELWQQATAAGRFEGMPVDIRDGYIHFSTNQQMHKTAAKHFAGQTGLKLLKIEACLLNLTWEKSHAGELFPHLYGVLPLSAVIKVWDLPVNEDGVHQFPECA